MIVKKDDIQNRKYASIADGEGKKLSRRDFLKVAGSTVLSAAAVCSLGPLYSLNVEPGWIEVVRQKVPIAGLPDELDGLTIAQLSDIHIGPFVDRNQLKRGVEIINDLRPDIVALTGDYVYVAASDARICTEELEKVTAKYGVYAVLGNHDIWTKADVVAEAFSAAGITVLRDEKVLVGIGKTVLAILGIEDVGFTTHSFKAFEPMWHEKSERLGVLLEDIPDGITRLLLVHNPDFTEMLPEARIDLALCGHTHGGQIRLPLIGAPIVPSCFGQKYTAGLVRGPSTLTYVNRGLGLIPPPIRFNCRPEVSLLQLTKV